MKIITEIIKLEECYRLRTSIIDNEKTEIFCEFSQKQYSLSYVPDLILKDHFDKAKIILNKKLLEPKGKEVK